MAVYKYDDLIAHKGHKIVCVTYGEERIQLMLRLNVKPVTKL